MSRIVLLILNCLGVYRRKDQVCDIGMPKLMRCHFKVQAVDYLAVVARLFSQNGVNGVLHILSSDKLLCLSRFRRPRCDIGPKTLELRICERLSILIGYNII